MNKNFLICIVITYILTSLFIYIECNYPDNPPIYFHDKCIFEEVAQFNNNVDIKSLSINQKNIEYILNNIEERLEKLKRLEKLLTFY